MGRHRADAGAYEVEQNAVEPRGRMTPTAHDHTDQRDAYAAQHRDEGHHRYTASHVDDMRHDDSGKYFRN